MRVSFSSTTSYNTEVLYKAINFTSLWGGYGEKKDVHDKYVNNWLERVIKRYILLRENLYIMKWNVNEL